MSSSSLLHPFLSHFPINNFFQSQRHGDIFDLVSGMQKEAIKEEKLEKEKRRELKERKRLKEKRKEREREKEVDREKEKDDEEVSFTSG